MTSHPFSAELEKVSDIEDIIRDSADQATFARKVNEPYVRKRQILSTNPSPAQTLAEYQAALKGLQRKISENDSKRHNKGDRAIFTLRLRHMLYQVVDTWRHLVKDRFWRSSVTSTTLLKLGDIVIEMLLQTRIHIDEPLTIYRLLFEVHAYLGHASLALQDFDGYVFHYVHGERPGEDHSTDNIIQLAADALRLLCKFCSTGNARATLSIAQMVERWMEDGKITTARGEPSLSPETISWRDSPISLPIHIKVDSVLAIAIAYATFAKTQQMQGIKDSMLRVSLKYHQQAVELRNESNALRPHELVDDPWDDATLDIMFVAHLLETELGNLRLAQPKLMQETAEALGAFDLAALTNKKDAFTHSRHHANPLSTLPIQTLINQIQIRTSDHSTSLRDAYESLALALDNLAFPTPSSVIAQLDLQKDLDVHHKINLIEQACLTTILAGLCNEDSQFANNYCQGVFALIARLFGPLGSSESATKTVTAPSAPSSSPPKSRGSIRKFVSRAKLNKDEKKQSGNRATLPEVPHNMPNQGAEPPVRHRDQPPVQDHRPPTAPRNSAPTVIEDGRAAVVTGSEAPTIHVRRVHLVADATNERYRNAALINVWILASKLAATHGDCEASLQAAHAAARYLPESVDANGYPKAGRPSSSTPDGDTALGSGMLRAAAELRADVFAAEADALLIGSGPMSEPFASMAPVDSWRQFAAPDAPSKKKATALYREALNMDPCHHDANIGLCRRLLEDTVDTRHAKTEAHQRLQRLVESSNGAHSPAAWMLYGQVSMELCVYRPLGVDPFAEAAKWEGVAGLRPWGNVNAGGFVLL